MAKVKAGLRNLTAEQMVTKANSLVSSMTSNPNFQNPNPSLQTVANAASDLKQSIIEAQTGSHYAVRLKRERYAILQQLIISLSAYVQNVCKGNSLIILSSGFEVAQKGEPVGILDAVNNLRAKVSQYFPGQITLEWDGIKKGCISYIVRMSTVSPGNSEDANWQNIGYPRATKFIVTGLTPARNYWFQVIPVGTKGSGGICSPICQMAF